MSEQPEGADFLAQFENGFLNNAATEARLKLDRRAGMSAKHRSKSPTALRDQQMNFRASKDFKAAANQLAEAFGCSMADIIHEAVFDKLKAYKAKKP
jgi:predicted HicB family RNase H-like nuclease